MKISLRRSFDDGAHQIWKNLPENLVREVFGNALFVEFAFFKGFFMEGARISPRRHECLAAEHKVEDLQPVTAISLIEREKPVIVPWQVQDRGDVEFEELLGYRSRTREIQPPLRAVGQNAPT